MSHHNGHYTKLLGITISSEKDVTSSLLFIYWDPNPVAFTIPYFNHPVMWYGILFVFGFFIGYFLLSSIFSRRLEAAAASAKEKGSLSKTSQMNFKEVGAALADRMLWFSIIGAIVGARLGHILFYDLPRYATHPLDIFKIWEGGLASHGGAIGAILAVFLFARTTSKKYPCLSFLAVLDSVIIPTAFIGMCIRIGNFINQEILGTPTNVPWAVVFGHPADGGPPVPRHPAQLYEAVSNLIIFLFLCFLWRRKGPSLPLGLLSGLFFTLNFGSRLLIECIKSPQSLLIDESFLTMGHYLSIPFIVLGIGLCFYAYSTKGKTV